MNGGMIDGLERNWPHRGLLQHILVNRIQTKAERVKIKHRQLGGHLKGKFARLPKFSGVCVCVFVCVCVYLGEKDREVGGLFMTVMLSRFLI